MNTKYTKPESEEQIQEVKVYTHNQLHEALMWIQDLLERSLIDFVLLGDTAEKIASYELPVFDMNKIHVGITRPHYHRSGKSALRSLLDLAHVEFIEDENSLLMEYKGIPIQIDIIDNYYEFLVYPDVRFYTITEFRIPNPMSAYLKVKDNVK